MEWLHKMIKAFVRNSGTGGDGHLDVHSNSIGDYRAREELPRKKNWLIVT